MYLKLIEYLGKNLNKLKNYLLNELTKLEFNNTIYFLNLNKIKQIGHNNNCKGQINNFYHIQNIWEYSTVGRAIDC